MSGSTDSLASSAPPPYHEVVGRQSSPAGGGFKSEKAALGDSQGSSGGGKPRRGLLKRIWARLTCSRPSQQPPPATAAQEPKPPVTPKEPEKEASRWKKPELTVQRGRRTRFVRSKYLISRYHCPIDRMTEEEVDAAPWVATLSLRGDDLIDGLLQHVPWNENLDNCWSDQVSIRTHPFNSDRLLYARRIMLAYKPAHGHGWEWTATATIYHKDIDWLTGLSYLEVGAYFRHELMVRAAAFVHPTRDPLEHGQMFYRLTAKPLEDGTLPPSSAQLQEPHERDEPELRRHVHKYFEKHIPSMQNW